MRHLAVATCILFLQALAVAGQQPSEPEAVYRQYLAAFKTIHSLDDRSLDVYLSKTAQKKMAEARLHPEKKTCGLCPSPEQEVRMMKAMRPYPGPEVRPVRTESGGIVTLTYKWHEAPGSDKGFSVTGSDVSVKAELVHEEGWKLKSESWVFVENPGTATARGTTVWSY